VVDPKDKYKRHIVIKMKKIKKHLKMSMPKPTQVETPKNVYKRRDFKKQAMDEAEEYI
jgi:hypothetical protein